MPGFSLHANSYSGSMPRLAASFARPHLGLIAHSQWTFEKKLESWGITDIKPGEK